MILMMIMLVMMMLVMLMMMMMMLVMLMMLVMMLVMMLMMITITSHYIDTMHLTVKGGPGEQNHDITSRSPVCCRAAGDLIEHEQGHGVCHLRYRYLAAERLCPLECIVVNHKIEGPLLVPLIIDHTLL